jgi:3-hydroxyacyl-CoA dehydrogenase / enoyl-CoA hydratase / 3-hydroxybutyryl-CoA epimerase
MDLKHFTLHVDDGVAVVLMDKAGSPINTIDPEVATELAALADQLADDDAVEAVVMASAKPSGFLAGADINYFVQLDSPEAGAQAMRELHGVFFQLERLHTTHGKPLVMAIDGPALGGGNELALAGSMRIAADNDRTQLGQPEVRLGLIPGGGGTQRLPKVVGIAAALDLILTGRSARPYQARKIGLVDEIVPVEVLLDVAKQRARESVGHLGDRASPSMRDRLSPTHLQALALEQNPVGRRVLYKKAEDATLAETKGNYPAPPKALEAVKIGVELGPDAGYDAEARFFGELVVTPESKALRSLFFATQAMKHVTGISSKAQPTRVDKVAVLGGGLMGAGIATVSALNAGSTVRIKEIDDDAVGRALAHVRREIDKQVERRRLNAFEGEQTMNLVTGAGDWDGFANSDLVIEAVFESLDLKRSILDEVEDVVGDDVVFASNTSSLPIGDIAAKAKRPELVLGMHYFSPVEKMPLLEVIVTDQTADRATATAVEYGKRQGKTVIVVKDGPGFYTTRILIPYFNEAFFLLGEGASVEAIDEAMVQWGFPVGPILLADEVGIDVGAHISQIMIDAFGERMAGPQMMSGLVDDDRKGRKNGRGFYTYDKGKRGGVDETVYAALGLGPRRAISRHEIQDRISLAMIDEAARCLEDGILQSALDGDIGAVMGLGFPPFRGGPFWWIDSQGAARIVERLDDLAKRHGARFETAQILRDHADSGRAFR